MSAETNLDTPGPVEPDSSEATIATRNTKKAPTESKPRASRVRTRSVASLSADQLARKRATDRAAKRAERDRTQGHIERLKRRIVELSNAQTADPALEEVKRRNSELEAELRHLQNALYGRGSNDGYPRTDEIPSPRSLPLKIEGRNPFSAGSSLMETSAEISTSVELVHQFNSPQPGHGIPFRGGRLDQVWPLPGGVPTTAASVPNSRSLSTATGLESIHKIPSSFVNRPSIFVWELPLPFAQPSSPLESLLFGIIQHQRDLVIRGATGTAAIGPLQPSMKALTQPERSNTVHPLTRFLSEILRALFFRDFLEKIGALILIYPVFQWQIRPCYETFSRLPEFLIPRPSQANSSYPIWITYIIFPKLRDTIIANQERYTTEEFWTLHCNSLNMNWPHGTAAALRWYGNDIRVTENFARHARTLENWSLEEPFQRAFPELRDVCRFSELPGQDSGSSNQ